MSVQLSVRGSDSPGVPTPYNEVHRCVLVDWCGRGEVSEPVDDLAGGQVGITRLFTQHRIHPARVVQPQRVPSLRPPCLAGPSSFAHGMVDTALEQRCARSQPGRPGTDDQAVN